MINKEYLQKIISEEFPDLRTTRFTMNRKSLNRFSETSLLPFLIYQNTMDSKNRLIEIYLQPDSPSMYFLPFYIALGFYRKAVNKALNAEAFYSTRFQPNTKQVVVGGNVCSITTINYLSQTVLLYGNTHHFEIPFDQDFKLKWHYQNAFDLRDNITRFQKLRAASDDNIFSLPIRESDREHEGLMLFTQISKFELLLQNLTISGSGLKDHLNIQKTIFTDDTISLKQLSAGKTKKLPMTVLVSRSDTLFAFDEIVSRIGPKLDQLRTIVIEDFDLLLRSWDRVQELEDNLARLDKIYFSRLGSVFRDIYLICSNRNFDIHAYLISRGIKPMVWMLKLEEACQLDELGMSKEVLVKRVSDDKSDNAVVHLEALIKQWRSLAASYFCNGEVLAMIKKLYYVRGKMRSFYRRSSFNAELVEMIDAFSQFAMIWFAGNQDHGLVDETCIALDGLLKAEFDVNSRLSVQLGQMISSGEHSRVCIVSNNNDTDDQYFLAASLSLPKDSIRFIDTRDLVGKRINIPPDELVVYLVWNKELINVVMTDNGLPSQLFLVDKRGYDFLGYYHKKAQLVLNGISSVEEKYQLLNISPNENKDGETLQPVRFTFLSEVPEIDEQEIAPLPEEDEAVKEIVWNMKMKSGTKFVEGVTYLVFFEDGSQSTFQQHQSVFFYQEKHDDTNGELEKDIKNLEAGDQVIVPKDRGQIRKLLNDALSGHEGYRQSVTYDLKWRKQIASFVEKNNGDVSFFRQKLNENGFPIASDFTIKKWIDGETLQPQRFKQLILILVKLGFIDDGDKDLYYREISELKKIKSKFVKTAIQKLIYSLKGINYGWEANLFDDSLLNRFIDHVEIKTVLLVVTK